MFLDYLALAIILIVLVAVFYGFIYIHDIPHEIAKERKHPHVEAIHVACWLSLFTLHAIWPIVFIWAVSKKKPNEATGDGPRPVAASADNSAHGHKLVEVAGGEKGGEADLRRQLKILEERLSQLEGRHHATPDNRAEAL
jgi:hypothetical protein